MTFQEVKVKKKIRNKSYRVGISETIRKNFKFSNNGEDIKVQKFNQWLAGLIDGDGYLGVSKAGYVSSFWGPKKLGPHNRILSRYSYFFT